MTATNLIPHLRNTGSTTQLIVHGQPTILLAGELRNSVPSHASTLEPALDKLVALHANSAILPVYWEFVEPEEGRFDFTHVDLVLQSARARNLKLVLLWFGVWKNALSSYAPAWVKTNLVRFPRAQCTPGKNTMAISAISENIGASDARAFAALMAHLRKVDGQQHTVVMVQVENETGLLGASRDHNPLAEAAFAAPVPQDLLAYLQSHKNDLGPELAAAWKEAGSKSTGTWPEIFGVMADEAFMAWHVARTVGRIAQAGKDIYPLPMFANAWLIWGNQPAGEYPSGGPVMRVLDIWRAAAPAVDLLAPDIYLEDFRATCADFHRRGNPLLIPEARPDERAATTAIYALAQHDALCFAPYALEDAELTHPIAHTYAWLTHMMPTLLAAQGTGRMIGLLQQVAKEKTQVTLAGYPIKVEFKQPMSDIPQPMSGGKLPAVPAGGFILSLGNDQFLIGGLGLGLEFLSPYPDRPNIEFLTVDEGAFHNNTWIPARRLNGDESGHGRWINLPPQLTLVRVHLHCYP